MSIEDLNSKLAKLGTSQPPATALDPQVEAIFARMEKGENYSAACRAEGHEPGAMWKRVQASELSRKRYARAMDACIEFHSEELLAIADNPHKGEIRTTK